ncbi:MAG: NIPSNAP family protein [Minwuia sp.]|uniref:NIPSNAP family protein n=1 Tax=Minwuia sp. TaxID=2493630 RepID=UPI003A87BF5A
MAIYELRTYTLYAGKLGEAVELYRSVGWPALEKHGDKLVGYFTGDVGALNKIVHIWKFEDDADRRAHWNRVYADDDFMAFAAKFRPLILTQDNQLMMAAPRGPTP